MDVSTGGGSDVVKLTPEGALIGEIPEGELETGAPLDGYIGVPVVFRYGVDAVDGMMVVVMIEVLLRVKTVTKLDDGLEGDIMVGKREPGDVGHPEPGGGPPLDPVGGGENGTKVTTVTVVVIPVLTISLVVVDTRSTTDSVLVCVKEVD
ncbi:hypothetical protein MMC20_000833 [Loxospora ochrophaea]|nr:hypothetical protein [Loxospora ochrophaea]